MKYENVFDEIAEQYYNAIFRYCYDDVNEVTEDTKCIHRTKVKTQTKYM